MSTTRLSRTFNAPPATVYRALTDARAVASWMVPTGMTSEVHRFEPWVGGSFRISLTYEQPTGGGKTSAHTDTYGGRFVALVPNERVVQVLAFETEDPAMRGEMTMTFTLTGRDGGTDMLAVHEGVPPGGVAGRQRDRLADGPRQARRARRARTGLSRPSMVSVPQACGDMDRAHRRRCRGRRSADR